MQLSQAESDSLYSCALLCCLQDTGMSPTVVSYGCLINLFSKVHLQLCSEFFITFCMRAPLLQENGILSFFTQFQTRFSISVALLSVNTSHFCLSAKNHPTPAAWEDDQGTGDLLRNGIPRHQAQPQDVFNDNRRIRAPR